MGKHKRHSNVDITVTRHHAKFKYTKCYSPENSTVLRSLNMLHSMA